jgi:hypothetical protein
MNFPQKHCLAGFFTPKTEKTLKKSKLHPKNQPDAGVSLNEEENDESQDRDQGRSQGRHHRDGLAIS